MGLGEVRGRTVSRTLARIELCRVAAPDRSCPLKTGCGNSPSGKETVFPARAK